MTDDLPFDYPSAANPGAAPPRAAAQALALALALAPAVRVRSVASASSKR